MDYLLLVFRKEPTLGKATIDHAKERKYRTE